VLHGEGEELAEGIDEDVGETEGVLEGVRGRASELWTELEATEVNEGEPGYETYQEFYGIVKDVQDRLQKADGDLEDLKKDLEGYISELEGNKENLLENPRIQEIIDALKDLRNKLDEIDGEARDLDSILDPDTFAKIKDFLRDHRGEQMGEAD